MGLLSRSAGQLTRKRFVTGIDASNKKWQVMVSVLCNRRPLIAADMNDNAAYVKQVNLDAQESSFTALFRHFAITKTSTETLRKAKVAALSTWEKNDNEQQSLIEQKAKGKYKGELSFMDSSRDTLEKRKVFYDKFNTKKVREDQHHKHPTQKLTLLNDDTILPMAEVKDSLMESAKALLERDHPELSVQFTSPFPVGNYQIGFGKEARNSTGLDGLQVFIMHAYAKNEFDLIYDDKWKTDGELESLKKTANSNRKPIYREICAVN